MLPRNLRFQSFDFLNSMGANIIGAGTDEIRIRGVKRLNGTTFKIEIEEQAHIYSCFDKWKNNNQ